MLVDHIHADINASFGRWSMKLWKNDCPTIPLLMKLYTDCDEDLVIPSFIEEVPNSRSFSSLTLMMIHWLDIRKGRRSLFYRGKNNNSLMQYKLGYTDEKWLLEEGIQLWKVD